jgi:hypothetical protein
MQTESDAGTRSSWSDWAKFLHRHRLQALASWTLEALGPLMILGAELFHAASPLLRPALSGARAASIARLLEDPAEALEFARYLRREGCS